MSFLDSFCDLELWYVPSPVLRRTSSWLFKIDSIVRPLLLVYSDPHSALCELKSPIVMNGVGREVSICSISIRFQFPSGSNVNIKKNLWQEICLEVIPDWSELEAKEKTQKECDRSYNSEASECGEHAER
nr:unnamed protein product [Callosobruchus chinensis]